MNEIAPLQNDFWRVKSWPLNPKGWVFIAEAVEAIGPKLSPDWTGDEFGLIPLHKPLAPILPKLDDFTSDSLRARWLLQRYAPESLPKRGVLSATFVKNPLPPPPTSIATWRSAGLPRKEAPLPEPIDPAKQRVIDDDNVTAYAEARRIEQAYAAAHSERAARATQLARTIVKAFLDEDLRAGFIYPNSGEMYDVPPAWWNTDFWWPRFDTGKIAWRYPIKPTAHLKDDDLAWLFVRRDSMDAYLAQLIAPPPEPSAWMAGPQEGAQDWAGKPVVIDAARERLRIDGARNPSKEKLCLELVRMWELSGREKKSWRTFEKYIPS